LLKRLAADIPHDGCDQTITCGDGKADVDGGGQDDAVVAQLAGHDGILLHAFCQRGHDEIIEGIFFSGGFVETVPQIGQVCDIGPDVQVEAGDLLLGFKHFVGDDFLPAVQGNFGPGGNPRQGSPGLIRQRLDSTERAGCGTDFAQNLIGR